MTDVMTQHLCFSPVIIFNIIMPTTATKHKVCPKTGRESPEGK